MKHSRYAGGPLRAATLVLLTMIAAPHPSHAEGLPMFDTIGVSDKPQSKLWFNDNFWWCCANNKTKLSLYQLNAGTWTPKFDLQAAVVPIAQGGTADALWDGTNLFVVAYGYSTSKLYKYSYDSVNKTYVLLAGFPVSLPMRPGSETIVLDKDSTGRLWVTYQSEDPTGKIYVNWSTSADHKTWNATPLAISTTSPDPDDISTVVAFGGNKIGVCWSDQVAAKLFFRWRNDTDPPASWQTTETIKSGFASVDDHINMKADSHGQIYVAAKDFYNSVYVARRNLDGTWTLSNNASGLDCGTRPIIQIDEADNKLYVFYTRWETCDSVGNHAIQERVSNLDNLLFSLPTTIVALANTAMNEVQGTKQILPSGCMAILCEGATTNTNKAYWNGWGSISGIGGSDPGGTLAPPPSASTNLIGETVTENPATPLLLWRFDENSGTTTVDASGHAHTGTLSKGSTGPLPQWAPGARGTGLYLDGDAYVTTSGSGFAFTGQSFTLEAWINTVVTSGSNMIIARGDTANCNYFFDINGTALSLSWSVNDTTNTSVTATVPVNNGAWHHVAAVWDQSAKQGRIYFDGHLSASKSAAAPGIGGSWPLTIGAIKKSGSLGRTFKGKIDLVRISNTAVYTSDFPPPLLFPTVATRYARIHWTAPTSDAGVSSYKVDRAVNGGASAFAGPSVDKGPWFADMTPPDGFLDYTVKAVDGLNQTGSPADVILPYSGLTPQVTGAPQNLAWTPGTATVDGSPFWEFTEGTGSTSTDGTGLGHTLQLGGAATGDNAEPAWTFGESDEALHFDGTNDYALLADHSDLRFTTSFTLEAWVRRTRLNSQQGIITKDAGQTARNYGMLILSNGNIEFSWTKSGSTTVRKATSTTGITDMNWHHIACVYNSGTATNFIYLDGVQVGTAGVAGTPYTGAEPVILGARGTATPNADWLNGDLDLVRISSGIRYSGPFTPPQLYRGGAQRHVVNVTWGLPPTGFVKDYHVYRQQLPSGTNTLIGSMPYSPAPFILDTNVQAGITYRYTVKATNSANTESAASAPLDVAAPDPTDVASQGPPAVHGPNLHISPNPFNPTATVSFHLDQAGPVELTLFDARGRLVRTVAHAVMQAGDYRLPLLQPNAPARLASGIYFLQLEAGGQEVHMKTVLLQ